MSAVHEEPLFAPAMGEIENDQRLVNVHFETTAGTAETHRLSYFMCVIRYEMSIRAFLGDTDSASIAL